MGQSQTDRDLMRFLSKVAEELKGGQYEKARRRCVSVLKGNPRSAQAWVFLGESLERLGIAGGAWKAYNRGWILDPQATWVEPMQKRLIGRWNEPVPDWLISLLAVPKVTVAAALIAKNEARKIDETLIRLQTAVDEIVLVDTGSTDETIEIAKKQGANVYSFPWQDNFSAARNFGLEKVTSDWVLWVDADELLDLEDVEVPRIAAGLFDAMDPLAALRIVQVNHTGTTVEPNYDMVRLFPMRKGLCWYGTIHEQVGFSEEEPKIRAIQKPVIRIRVHHDGYDPTIMEDKQKLQRNIILLRKTVETDPQAIASWGFLGRELLFSKQYEQALQAFKKVEELAPYSPYYARLSEVRLFTAQALEALEQHQEAINIEEKAVQEEPNYPGTWFHLGNLKLKSGLKMIQEAREAFIQSLETSKAYRGMVTFDSQIGSWKASTGIADTYKFSGNLVEAHRWYQMALLKSGGQEAIQTQLRSIEQQASLLQSLQEEGLDVANKIPENLSGVLQDTQE
ncbi:glycosyltransferase [Alicyclobacillaceae bacterium I2511]|nr:glycosyltransferase [Alicyclobacillaceae bacterium I2511]